MNPKFLGKLGNDEGTRKQFEEDVKYLNDFARRFREQQLSQGREIISQGWFCDENGNWGGWTISRPVKQSSVLQDMADNAEEIRQKKLEERKQAEQELKGHFGDRFKCFNIKLLEEDIKSEETTSSSTYSNIPFNSFSDAFLTAAHISSYVAGFSKFTVKSTTETSTVGTLNAIPVNFPFNSGITFPTAFAAPVDDGIMF